jgi:hypothetical protein
MHRWGWNAALVGMIAASTMMVTSCGGGGGGSPAPSPAPTPAPTPTPVPAPTPTLSALAHQPPEPVFLAMLLTDGRVLAQAAPDPAHGVSAADFFILTPDAAGSYANGHWHQAASPPTGYAPWATSEAVLPDGRVLFLGGEYNRDEYSIPFKPSGLTNMSALYDPVADSWTMLPAPPGEDYIGDPAGVLLPDGRYVFGDKLTNRMFAFDLATMQWGALPFTGYTTDFAEMGFTLLPNGAVLSVDVRHAPKAWHFVPQTAAWIGDPNTPANLTEQTAGAGVGYGPRPALTVGGVTYAAAPAGTYFPPGEIGPQMLRPDGTVWVVGAANTGATAHTAVYHPGPSAAQSGTWTTGPNLPANENADDASAALLVNGHVLLAGNSDALYEFDGATIVQTRAPPAVASGIFLLPLPSGEALVLTPGEGTHARVYMPVGGPLAQWRPTITSMPGTITRGTTAQLTGTQLNGLSEAAKYGDEFDAATNYPIVRLKNVATGHVAFCRTHGYPVGVGTGVALITTSFDIPAGAETGASKLAVIANGIASAEANVTVN